MRQHFLEPTPSVPIFPAWGRVGAIAHAIGHDPVNQLFACLAACNGIKHQLVVKAPADDHGAPVEEGLGGGGAAPHQYAIPLEARFVRIEPPAHGGMNAVAANENVAGDRRACAARALEAGFDAALLLGKGDKGGTTTDGGAAKPLPHGIAQHAWQIPAVKGELRHLVASFHSARLAPFSWPKRLV